MLKTLKYFGIFSLLFLLSSFLVILPDSKKFSGNEIISVRVMSTTKITSLLIAPQKGAYSVQADGKNIYTIPDGNLLKATLINDSIELKAFDTVIGFCKYFKMVSLDEEKGFKIKALQPERKPRYYDDNIYVSIEGTHLKLVNQVNLDHYIAGVSEAEAGSRSLVEFYKVQAILARTYALAHVYKHQADGYNLCDQVHCQAFYGKSHDAEVLEAVAATKGLVVVDDDLRLITAAFHSNSGGETMNSEDVWGSRTSYLRSVKDSFSLNMPNAIWERRMSKEDWLSYLKIKHNYPVEDSLAILFALNFKQYNRKSHFSFGSNHIHLKNIRTDLQLKSTFFSIEPKGDSVIFKGRGFGHGLGMCQEGAMKMTKLGYGFKDVLHFYYKNVHLINLKELHFFKEE